MRRSSRIVRARAGWRCFGIVAAIVAATLATPLAAAQTRDPVLEFLEAAAGLDGRFVAIEGDRVPFVDPPSDQTNPAGAPPITSVPQNDLLVVEHLSVDAIARDLLAGPFACDAADAACSSFGSEPSAFDQGAVLLYQGLAGDPRVRDPLGRYEWAILGRDPDFPPPPAEPARPDDPFAGAVSHEWRVRMGSDATGLELEIFADGQLGAFRTHARAVLTADGIFWLIPRAQEWDQITGFDAYADVGIADTTGFDTLRQPPVQSASMPPVTPGPLVTFTTEPPPPPSPPPTAGPSAASAPDETTGASARPSATPDTDETPGSATGSFPWQALILLGGILAVIALGLRFRRFRAPVEPTTPAEPTTSVAPTAPAPSTLAPSTLAPPPAVAVVCADGDEEWRDDAPPGDFLVPDPSETVRIAIDPVAPALEDWIDGFGMPRGIPIDAFGGIDDNVLARLLAGLPTTPSRIECELVIPLLLRELQCQRRWVCDGGTWTATAERRMVEATPSPLPRTFRSHGPDRTVDDVVHLWRDAAAALRAAEGQAADAERYRADCR